jgi:hypothetical protein
MSNSCVTRNKSIITHSCVILIYTNNKTKRYYIFIIDSVVSAAFSKVAFARMMAIEFVISVVMLVRLFAKLSWRSFR